MFKLTFDSMLVSNGVPMTLTLFCKSFTAYESRGFTGGYLFTEHSNGQKKHHVTVSNVKVETV